MKCPVKCSDGPRVVMSKPFDTAPCTELQAREAGLRGGGAWRGRGLEPAGLVPSHRTSHRRLRDRPWISALPTAMVTGTTHTAATTLSGVLLPAVQTHLLQKLRENAEPHTFRSSLVKSRHCFLLQK